MTKQVNVQKATPTELYAKKAPYSSVSNDVVAMIVNPDALAIWIYLQTRSSDWKVIASYLQDRFSISRDRYWKAMACLKELGLLSYETLREEGTGKMLGKRIIVHYEPNLPKTVGSDNRRDGSPSIRENDHYSIKDSITGLSKGKKVAKAPAAAQPTPPNVQFDGTDFVVTEALLTKWAKAFPGVNIDLEVERASVWAASNPPKKDWQRFLSNWLSKKSGTVVDETNVPVDQIIDLYKQVCPNLPAVTVAGDKILRSMIVERWNESPTHQSGKDFWLPFFQKANNRNQVFFRGANVVPRLEALVSRSVFREISEAAQ